MSERVSERASERVSRDKAVHFAKSITKILKLVKINRQSNISSRNYSCLAFYTFIYNCE